MPVTEHVLMIHMSAFDLLSDIVTPAALSLSSIVAVSAKFSLQPSVCNAAFKPARLLIFDIKVCFENSI